MATKPEVYKALLAVTPLFPHYKPPADDEARAILTNSWHMMVGHLENDVLMAAFKVAAGKSEFFPTPALVLECAVSLTTPDKRSGADAWGDVVRAINEHHSYHPPDTDGGALDATNYRWSFTDKIAGKIVNGMGWLYLCMSTDQMADRAHFIKGYEQERDRVFADARLTAELLAFRDEKRGALTAPVEISLRAKLPQLERAQALMSGIGKGKAG